MKCGEKVLYLNRPAWIVGVRMPNHIIGEVGKHYDLVLMSKKSPQMLHTVIPDFRNIAAKHIKPYEEITPVACNGSVQFIKHPVLVKA